MVINKQYNIQFQRYGDGWLSIECMKCRAIIWQGEESWWSIAKLCVGEFFHFIERHECNSHK